MRNYFTLLAFGMSTPNAGRARPRDGMSSPCLAGRPPRNDRKRCLLLDDEGLPEKRAHSVSGLRPLRQPRLDGGGIEVRLLLNRVVPSKLLLVKKKRGREVSEALRSAVIRRAIELLGYPLFSVRPSGPRRERAKRGAFRQARGRARHVPPGGHRRDACGSRWR